MTTNEEMQEVLRQARDAIASATHWTFPHVPKDVPAGTFVYQTTSGPWKIVAVEFSIEDQGFPPGSMGYDGAASRTGDSPVLLHLTRDLAKAAVDKAKDWINTNGASA